MSRKLVGMNYATEQRKNIISYFEKRLDESVSAAEIASALAFSVSKSAVYRNLALLEKEGKIVRVQSGDRTGLYRYVASGKCEGKIHMSCVRCGKTEHVSAEAASRFEEALKDTDGFSLNKGECMLFGVCKDCSGRAK